MREAARSCPTAASVVDKFHPDGCLGGAVSWVVVIRSFGLSRASSCLLGPQFESWLRRRGMSLSGCQRC